MDMMISSTDLSEAVRETAMLADVTVHLWGAERSDKTLMQRIKDDAGAVGNVGRVVKNMLAGADGALKDTRSAFSQVRTAHYALTLPWVADPHAEQARGPRLLPNMLWERYTQTIAKKRTEAYQVRDNFLAEYPDLIARAKANLGTMADADYPDADEVRRQCRITIDFEPIPAGASFRGLPEHMLGKLSKALQAKQTAMIRSAQSAMWEDAREKISHLAGKLSDPEAVFRTTTVEGVRDLLTLLPGFNVAGDARVDEIVADIERMLAGVDVKALRDNTSVRQDVASQASNVAEKLSAWGL